MDPERFSTSTPVTDFSLGGMLQNQPMPNGKPPQLAIGAAAGPMAQWTSNDALSLSRLSQAESTLQTQIDDGAIHPQDAATLHAEIQRRKAPLMQRQEAFQKQQKEQAYQQAMEQHAQLVAMDEQGRKYRAQHFNDRVVPLHDPISGRMTYMYEDARGKWAEVKFEGTEDEAPDTGVA